VIKIKEWKEWNSFIQWICIIGFFLIIIMVFIEVFYFIINIPDELILGIRENSIGKHYLNNPELVAEMEALASSSEFLHYTIVFLLYTLICIVLFFSYNEVRENEKIFKKRKKHRKK